MAQPSAPRLVRHRHSHGRYPQAVADSGRAERRAFHVQRPPPDPVSPVQPAARCRCRRRYPTLRVEATRFVAPCPPLSATRTATVAPTAGQTASPSPLPPAPPTEAWTAAPTAGLSIPMPAPCLTRHDCSTTRTAAAQCPTTVRRAVACDGGGHERSVHRVGSAWPVDGAVRRASTNAVQVCLPYVKP